MLNVVLLIFLMGCRDNKIAQEDTQGWWESESETKADDGSEEKEESFEEGEDKDLEELEACPEDFDLQASCEGTWEATMCYYDGLIWWCQDGVWLNEDDK